MADEFRLEYEDSPGARREEPRPAKRSHAADFEDDGREYEVDEQRPPAPNLPPEKPTEDIDELWWRSYEEEYGPRRSFSIAEMLGVTTMVAVSLTVVRWLPIKVAAAMLGVAVIIGLMVLADDSPKPRFLHLLFWTILIAYLCVAAFAAVATA